MAGSGSPQRMSSPGLCPSKIKFCRSVAARARLIINREAADMLVELAAYAELFHTATGVAYADLAIGGHRETWPIRSTPFRGWLRRCYYQATADAPSAAALNSVLNLLEARAQFDGPERTVHVRVAEHDGHDEQFRPACCRSARLIEVWLAAEPQLTAIAFFRSLAELYPDHFGKRQHSIVQRLLRALRKSAAI
jgi:hypothetical protein